MYRDTSTAAILESALNVSGLVDMHTPEPDEVKLKLLLEMDSRTLDHPTLCMR